MDDSEPPKPRSRRNRAAPPSTPETPAAPTTRAKAAAPKATPRTTGTAKTAPAKATPATPTKKAAPAKVTAPVKKTTAKKAAAKKAAPVPDTEPVRTPAPTPTGTAVPRLPEERLAQTAVQRYGSAARTWAASLRTTYPRATPDGLARLAARDHVRLARATGAAAALSGPLGPVLNTAAVLALQARLVVHVAAAYGVEPAEAEIRQLISTPATLRSASLNAVARLLPGAALVPGVALVPGAALVLGPLADGRLLDRLATRAIDHYRSHPSRSFNSV